MWELKYKTTLIIRMKVLMQHGVFADRSLYKNCLLTVVLVITGWWLLMTETIGFAQCLNTQKLSRYKYFDAKRLKPLMKLRKVISSVMSFIRLL